MPKKTLETIIDSQNDYIVQVKKNQPKLYEALEETIKTSQPVAVHQTKEKSRGRNEIRKAQLFLPIDNIPPDWPSLNSIIRVERFTFRDGKDHYEESFYISSLKTKNVEQLALGIRQHWSIENRLHWVKDVLQNEDNARIKKGNGIETLSILRNIAINLSRGFNFDSIKDAQTYFASNVKELLKRIRI